MPITAFSASTGHELDVAQALSRLGMSTTLLLGQEASHIPDVLRGVIKEDMECPCCFVRGAEVVREGRSASGKVIRQPCFRFPEHKPHCDFSRSDDAKELSDNLVRFGSERSELTRIVGKLVCGAIHSGAVSQSAIRDMRKWFFSQKIDNSFVVSVKPSTVRWAADLNRAIAFSFGENFKVSSALGAVPGFDWKNAARLHVIEKYRPISDVVWELRLHACGDRVETIAKNRAGQTLFDPTPLHEKYKFARQLAWFMSHNYGPARQRTKFSTHDGMGAAMLAFAALLLFVSDWQMDAAIERFALSAGSAAVADNSLGNVVGLNPFHDYEVLHALKGLEELRLDEPQMTVADEIERMISALKVEFAIDSAR
jgi:hypothetical protein